MLHFKGLKKLMRLKFLALVTSSGKAETYSEGWTQVGYKRNQVLAGIFGPGGRFRALHYSLQDGLWVNVCYLLHTKTH